MSIKFNIDRPKISDQEINKNKNFNELVEQFKQHSLKKANADKSWWKNKIIRYSTLILGITVICSVSYLSIINNQKNKRQAISTNQSIKTKNKAFIQTPSQKITIPNTKYKVNTNKNTTVRYLGGADLNGSGNLTFGSILWPFTSAVNQIKLMADGSFVAGTKIALYGIKGD